MPLFLAHLHGARARIKFNAVDERAARRELGAWQDAFDRPLTGRFVWVGLGLAVTAIDECLATLGEEQQVRAAYADLQKSPWLRYVVLAARGADHLRGGLALRLGLVEEAEAHYRTGLSWAERERCPIEQGRCLQGLAEVAERRGQHAEAAQLLHRAATLFQQHGAALYLKQVLVKKEILQA